MPHRERTIVENLADREKLQGTARTRFARILEEDFAYESAGPRRRHGAWIAAAGGTVALLAQEIVMGERPTWTGGSAWLAVGLAGAIAIWICGRPAGGEDREAQWKVYCVLVRPVIVSRYPALLDRNRAEAKNDHGILPKGPLESLNITSGQSRREWGIAALVGLWIGAIGLRWVQPFGGDWSGLNAAVPAATAALAALGWAWWRWWALRAVIRSMPET